MAPIDPTTDASKEVYNHGMALDPENKRIQCCYCGKIVPGFNRLQHHLGGIRGNIVECPDVPSEVKEFFRDSLVSVKVGRLVKEVGELHHAGPPLKRSCTSSSGKASGVKLSEKSACTENSQAKGRKPRLGNSIARSSSGEGSSNRNGRSSSQIACFSKEGQDSVSIKAKRSIGRFFFENCIDFGAVTSHSLKSMMEIFLRTGEEMGTTTIPSIDELKGWVLDEELNDIENYVKEVRLSWPHTGCSILLDGWTDNLGRELINVIVDCCEGPVYLRSADVSPLTKGVNAFQLLLESVLEEVGIWNVVQIIAHTSSDSMEAVSKQLIKKYRSLFWNVSPAHCISLMLDKIEMMESIKLTIDQAKTITKFAYSHAEALKLLRQHISRHDLVIPSNFKAAGSFLTLENLLVEKNNLKRMISSSEWLKSSLASTVEGEKVANLIFDKSFWDGVTIAVKATIPLVNAISLINGDRESNMGFIYETMDQIKETISEEFWGRKSQYLPFWDIIDEVWNEILHSPLHAAGYYLNPRLQFSDDFYADMEVTSGLLVAVVRMVENKHTQDLVSQQLDIFGEHAAEFEIGIDNNSHNTLSPVTWWSRYGSSCPDLQKVSIRILSQSCKGAESYRLRRDLAEKLLQSGRNILEQQRLLDFTYVHYNLRLKNFRMGEIFRIQADEIDPMDDWIVQEQNQHDSESGLDTLVTPILEPKCEVQSPT